MDYLLYLIKINKNFISFSYIIATAMVVTCMMTLVTRIGPDHQKGAITGVFRSLGALARACGPIVASSGKDRILNYLIQ